MNVKCFLIEDTGRMTPFVDNVSHTIYKRQDNGQEISGHLPVGAMWFADPADQEHYPAGPDGRTLFVMTPAGSWCIDSRASNCTMPADNAHRCWCRKGTAPMISVDKSCPTCKAGGGSIQMRTYHGFLTNGELTNCP